MNTNIVITLDTRRQKKDKTYPLIMRLGHNERTTSIQLGINLLEKDWDDKNRIVRKTYEGVNTVSRLNNIIQKKKADAMDIIFKLHESKQLPLLSITTLREKIQLQGKTQSFFKYAEALVAELKKAKRIGTASSYQGVINVLKTFANGKTLSFTDINYSFLSRFETDHKSRGNGINGLAVYMRTIRAVYNRAIKEGVAEKESYPFIDYKIKTAPTAKRALEWELLNKIVICKIPIKHRCFNARNYFVASYMMYGMNFADMAFLKKTDIVNGRINYRRQKTSKLYDIKITDSLNKILSYYIELNPDSEYVFPIIKRETAETQAKDIVWARKRYNKRLKDIAELCGIETKVTSYVSRHSFATQAMLMEVPVKAISTMLGHSSLKTTETYLQSLPSNVLDDYNARIMKNKKSKPKA
ncbi:phage integrase SAM-like domain-containing protein [Ferruginibacter sp.]|nr:site-specific integrase [Ferruginibacter sp.]